MTAAPRHFADLDQVPGDALRTILDRAHAYKRRGRDHERPLAWRTLLMIFENPSTRPRVSFEVAMYQLGGQAITLASHELQLSRGETTEDTARVLSRYGDAIMLRTNSARNLRDLMAGASVPVINGLTDASHPCQLMADIMTLEEAFGGVRGLTVAWTGDGNNMAVSWIHAAVCFSFTLRLACPESLAPPADVLAWARRQGADVHLTDDPRAAVAGADVVVTDTWVSMGTDERDRHDLLQPYQVNEALMARAADGAVFMHCLPAHRGEEVTDAVIDGPASLVFDEAENRLHAQKGILDWCLG